MKSYRNPKATWLGSPNFSPDRNGHDMGEPCWVVLHTMVGWATAADARFQQATEQASATYAVKLDGTVLQWVDEKDAAWADGATGRGGKGDNLDSISIEHEDGGDYNGPRTPRLYVASGALVRDICTRYGIPIDRRHIIGHRECDYASTACPDALDLDRIVATAAAGGDTTAMTPDERVEFAEPSIRLAYFAFREGEPEQAGLDGWLARVRAGEAPGMVIAEIMDSTVGEVPAALARMRALLTDYSAGKLQGSAGPGGAPGPAGPPGLAYDDTVIRSHVDVIEKALAAIKAVL